MVCRSGEPRTRSLNSPKDSSDVFLVANHETSSRMQSAVESFYAKESSDVPHPLQFQFKKLGITKHSKHCPGSANRVHFGSLLLSRYSC